MRSGMAVWARTGAVPSARSPNVEWRRAAAADDDGSRRSVQGDFGVAEGGGAAPADNCRARSPGPQPGCGGGGGRGAAPADGCRARLPHLARRKCVGKRFVTRRPRPPQRGTAGSGGNGESGEKKASLRAGATGSAGRPKRTVSLNLHRVEERHRERGYRMAKPNRKKTRVAHGGARNPAEAGNPT